MSKYLGDNEAIFVLDGAGWHKSSSLKIPSNIHVVYLPPYSPELNPVERLWLHIKGHTIKNKVYDSLQELEDAVCQFVQNLDLDTVKNLCAFNY